MDFKTNDNITNLLQKFLDVQSRRAEVTAGNIANADTPGYVAKDLEFEEYLRDASRQAMLPAAQRREPGFAASMRVVEQSSDFVSMNGNTVDTGAEMAKLAEIGSQFNFGAKMLQSRLRLLRTAIREGR